MISICCAAKGEQDSRACIPGYPSWKRAGRYYTRKANAYQGEAIGDCKQTADSFLLVVSTGLVECACGDAVFRSMPPSGRTLPRAHSNNIEKGEIEWAFGKR